jgi:glycosyltransferase involved in cell wall biosynthesis
VTPANILLAIGSSEMGGGQKVFLSFARELHRRGCPAVAVLPEGPLVELVRPYVETLYVTNLSSVRALPRIAVILKRERAAIINAYLTKCGLLFAVVNLLYRRRLFCTLLNAATHEGLSATRRRVYPVLYWLLQQLSEGVIVNSEQNKRHLVAAAGMDPRKVRVIYSGIDIDAFASQQQPRAPGDRFVIGAVGRLSPEKGHVFLVRALAHLGQLDCMCLIVGDGPLRTELERVAVQEGVAQRIRFLGFQEHVAQVMSQMDVVVMPSLDETFGISIVEAFSLKKMVIASDVGGIPELVCHGDTGMLVPARDSVALAGAINYAFEHRSECERMGRNAYECAVNRFTAVVMADQTIGYFETATNVLGSVGH